MKKKIKKITAQEIRIEESNKMDNELLAERVKLLFSFCAELIPYQDRFEAVLKEAEYRSDSALSAAPIITAFGGDYESKHFEAELHRKRAGALLGLIKVLDETEKERTEFTEKQKNIQAGREQLEKILGKF